CTRSQPALAQRLGAHDCEQDAQRPTMNAHPGQSGQGTSSLLALVPLSNGSPAVTREGDGGLIARSRPASGAEHVSDIAAVIKEERGWRRRVCQATPTRCARCKYCLWMTMNSTSARPISNWSSIPFEYVFQ